MTGPQPNPIHELDAEAVERARQAEEARIGPKYVGDLPDDPEQAVRYHAGQDPDTDRDAE